MQLSPVWSFTEYVLFLVTPSICLCLFGHYIFHIRSFHVFHLWNFYLFVFIKPGLLHRQSFCLWNNDCFIEVLSLGTNERINLVNWYSAAAICRVHAGDSTYVLTYCGSSVPSKTLTLFFKISAAHRSSISTRIYKGFAAHRLRVEPR